MFCVDWITDILFEELRGRYGRVPEVIEYLDHVEKDMLRNLGMFRTGQEEEASMSAPEAMMSAARLREDDERWARYQVNLFVDNAASVGAPVVFEHRPTYYNVFGRVDYRVALGAMSTDFTMVHPGSIHRANGGFLVLQVKDVLASPLVWQTMKQALRSAEARIENFGEQMAALPTTSTAPEPIPLEVKIVLVGSPYLARLLGLYDEDFKKYFKVRADFDYTMELNQENIRRYASFVVSQIQEQGLLHFDASAIARLVEYSSRLADDQERLTTRFMDVVDLITEASYWALQAGRDPVSGADVLTAREERNQRSNMIETRLHELYVQDTIHVQVEGTAVGQVNGLAVIDMGDYAFGRPSRITASVSLGRGEVSNVEQESHMSGRIHSKGFHILLGYLMGKYGLDGPLPIRASITFEQTYEEIEGDSASSTELYALISSVANVPIAQGLAVTGSVDQKGRVQAVGGVTQKVEGYFEACKSKGLTGGQGVVLPAANVRNLVLDREVLDAVAAGTFHIYGVSSIDEGLELLTGLPAGEADAEGNYPADTVAYKVKAAIADMSERMRAHQRGDVIHQRVEVVQTAPAAVEGDERDRDKRESDGEPPAPPPA